MYNSNTLTSYFQTSTYDEVFQGVLFCLHVCTFLTIRLRLVRGVRYKT